jgi:hypothetical protein
VKPTVEGGVKYNVPGTGCLTWSKKVEASGRIFGKSSDLAEFISTEGV